jgi:hypothetical protein
MIQRDDGDGRARPGDFPLGSLESRAATWAVLQARQGMQSKPLIYRAPWVGCREEFEHAEVFDYATGLRIPTTCDAALQQLGRNNGET